VADSRAGAGGRRPLSRGMPPVVAEDCRLLVLGSLPGDRSIAEQQYYAHPRNAFWPIMMEVLDVRGAADYGARCRALVERGVGLWDVLEASHRKGSLDSAIAVDTARPNDFPALLQAHPGIAAIAFNGRKAADLFRRFCFPAMRDARKVALLTLPSTSPAHAAMSASEKLARWSVLRDCLATPSGELHDWIRHPRLE